MNFPYLQKQPGSPGSYKLTLHNPNLPRKRENAKGKIKLYQTLQDYIDIEALDSALLLRQQRLAPPDYPLNASCCRRGFRLLSDLYQGVYTDAPAPGRPWVAIIELPDITSCDLFRYQHYTTGMSLEQGYSIFDHEKMVKKSQKSLTLLTFSKQKFVQVSRKSASFLGSYPILFSLT